MPTNISERADGVNAYFSGMLDKRVILLFMNEQQIVDLLKQKQSDGTQAQLAREIGITPQYLHDVFHGRRAPGPKILEYLRIEKRETYVKSK